MANIITRNPGRTVLAGTVALIATAATVAAIVALTHRTGTQAIHTSGRALFTQLATYSFRALV